MKEVLQTNEGAPRSISKEAQAQELHDLEIQAKKLELLERQANLEDVQERLAERELKREQVRLKARTNGATLTSLRRDAQQIQDRCNHRKGGDGAAGVIGGQGHDQYFAVLKHTFANGDMHIRCVRCKKTWKPPIRSNYQTESSFALAEQEYKEAKQFLTNNRPSSSSMFKWSDNGDYYRELLSAS